jgi:AcrR family transcriptional regulator
MSQAERSAATRQRLLEAAAEIFAERGFRDATIQAICRKAKANIAAAHYHFGDKDALYAAVFDYAAQHARPDPPAAPDGTPPAELLRRHVTSFLERMLDRGRPAWTAKLTAREMIDPTPMLDRMIRRRMRDVHARFAGAIRALLGPAATDDVVRLCTISVIAQCVFYRHNAAIVTRLYPELAAPTEVGRIADHVTRFSLAAIDGLRRPQQRPRRRSRA